MGKEVSFKCPFCKLEYKTKNGLKEHMANKHDFLAPSDKSEGKSKGGRPSTYDDSYPQKLIDFFDIDPWYDKELEHFDKDGNVKWCDYKRMANRLPTLRGFSKSIGVPIRTVYDWLDSKHPSFHPEFSHAFTQAKDLQKWFLIENGLNSCYNPIFAKFTAINITDMRDKIEVPVNKDGEEVFVSGFRFVSRREYEKETNNPDNSA